MLTAILNSTHLERVNSIPPDLLHYETTQTYQALNSKSLSLSAISLAIGNLATSHGRLLGIYGGFDPARDCGWVVLSTKLRVLQPVPTDVPIKVETWVASIENGQLIREYRVSQDGRPFVEASHSFVLFDRSTRRIAIPPREARGRLRGRIPEFQFNLSLSRRAELPAFSADDQTTECIVKNSDIDQNKHLNNSVYLRWSESHLEQNGVSTNDTAQFRAFEYAIEFLSEASLGEKVLLRTKGSDLTTYFLPSDTTRNALAISKAALLS